jgi:hypothetical protein
MRHQWIVLRDEGKVVHIIAAFVLMSAARHFKHLLEQRTGLSHRCVRQSLQTPEETGVVTTLWLGTESAGAPEEAGASSTVARIRLISRRLS